MKESFRQCMAWLHTWTGLVVGWVLFFVFLTGTLAYVNDEISHWMRPEEPMIAALPSASDLLEKAERRLMVRAANAASWSISLPGARGLNELRIRWREVVKDTAARSAANAEILDPQTGEPLIVRVRETGGGYTLYWMHFFLHYVPRAVGIRIVGACSMIVLVAILSGIVTHRRIFRDFFTFRPGMGQRSWLDAHNLLAATALPFHLMITWSGLVFYLFAYVPVPLNALYPEGAVREQFRQYGYGMPPAERVAVPRDPPRAVAGLAPVASRAALSSMLAEAEARWGAGQVAGVASDHPSRVTFTSRATSLGRRDAPTLLFDGATGRPIENEADEQPWPARVNSVMLGLHEAHFAGPILRLLFICAGLAGTAMIATGLLLWSAKRHAKLAKGKKTHFGVAAVDILNLGTIVGLPVGIAAYFWANRLLPAWMDGRDVWEMHWIFIVWGLTFIVAIWRPQPRAWLELCSIAAAAYGLLPVVNAITTDRHLGVTIPAGDWVLAGFDLVALAVGLCFAALARSLYHKCRTGPVSRAAERAAMPAPGSAARVARGLQSARDLRAWVTPDALRRWSVASRVLAAAMGGYGLTTLVTIAVPLSLDSIGMNRPQALLATMMASFLLYAAIVMGVFGARSAGRAWAWIAGGSLASGLLIWRLASGGGA